MSTAAELSDRLVAFVVSTLDDLVAEHLPDFTVPGTFAGRRVEPDVPADLLFTLGHLSRSSVPEVGGLEITEAMTRLLARIDGRRTHTFFSYRVAETLLAFGPFEANPLLEGLGSTARDEVARACDTTEWIELLDQGLPRNYAAVLARAELARERLGLDVVASVLRALLDRVRALLAAEPLGTLDDSTAGVGRYDIYSLDVWLFTEPLAEALGPLWRRGAASAIELAELTTTADGTAVPWGRSTGSLGLALTIELAALAVGAQLVDDPGPMLRRAERAFRSLEGWFEGGLVTAHRHRSPYDYRGPFRRLQMTLDLLGKLAFSAVALRGRSEVAAQRNDLVPRTTWRPLASDRPAGVFVHRAPGVDLVVPFVGATRSDYLPAPRAPGCFEVPVDEDLACWVPMVFRGHQTFTIGGIPDHVEVTGNGLTASYRSLVELGHLDPAADAPTLPAKAELRYQVVGRTVELAVDLELEAPAEALTFVVAEAAHQPLQVDFDAPPGARADRIVVDGIKEWRSYTGLLPVVHQLDLDPSTHCSVVLRVTPKLRVASTELGHHYDACLYGPLRDRVEESMVPIGPRGTGGDLSAVDVVHLHWPEWFAFDDRALHEDLIAQLTEAGVPVVWTAHNLTPHSRDTARFDPIYQRWAETSAAIIHHSLWGQERFNERYSVPEATPQVVIAHGHFGDRFAEVAACSRAELEAELGLEPCGLRIGLFGAPRPEKQVLQFLAGVTRSERPDLQVLCTSLRDGETAPPDPRIVLSEPYRMVDELTYARRLMACDVVALPFEVDGDLAGTGLVADLIGLGKAGLGPNWGYLAESLGGALLVCGLDADEVGRAIDQLDPESVRAAQAASAERRAATDFSVVAERTFSVLEAVAVAAQR